MLLKNFAASEECLYIVSVVVQGHLLHVSRILMAIFYTVMVWHSCANGEA